MNTQDLILIIIAASIVHASLQLSISVLSLLSGHSLGRKTAVRRVTGLAFSYSLGSFTIILLLLSFLTLFLQNIAASFDISLTWTTAAWLAIVYGVIVWLFYFQRGKKGTVLWVPRQIARFLERRAKAATLPFETFSLGVLTPAIEIVFSIVPLFIAAIALAHLAAPLQIVGLALYVLVASLPHFIITAIIGGGRSVARIQKWRENNKRFIQFCAGSLLIILGCYLYVDFVMPYLAWSAG